MKMKNIYRLGAVALALATVVGCEEPQLRAPEVAPASATPTEEAITDLSGAEKPSQRTRQIDWTAARQARIQAIEAGHTADTVLAQASGNASLSPVPVMLPSGIVMPASQKQTVAFTPDGYFASYPGAKYDIIVNGTNEVFDTSAMDADEAERLEMKFDAVDAGAQVAFSRFGADYLVEFECNILDGDTGCITEEQALAVVNGLFVAVAE